MATAQTEANKRWQSKNRDKARYQRNRSTARSFISKEASLADLREITALIEARKTALNGICNDAESKNIVSSCKQSKEGE